MKKIILLNLMLFVFICSNAQQSSKVVYSNAMTHFYITCYTNDTSKVYAISETSVPLDNIWRFTDREETQVLRTFNSEKIRYFLSEVSEFEKTAKIGDVIECMDILIEVKRVMGIKCIVLTNTKSKVKFNTNRKSINEGLTAVIKYEQ